MYLVLGLVGLLAEVEDGCIEHHRLAVECRIGLQAHVVEDCRARAGAQDGREGVGDVDLGQEVPRQGIAIGHAQGADGGGIRLPVIEQVADNLLGHLDHLAEQPAVRRSGLDQVEDAHDRGVGEARAVGAVEGIEARQLHDGVDGGPDGIRLAVQGRVHLLEGDVEGGSRRDHEDRQVHLVERQRLLQLANRGGHAGDVQAGGFMGTPVGERPGPAVEHLEGGQPPWVLRCALRRHGCLRLSALLGLPAASTLAGAGLGCRLSGGRALHRHGA